MNVMTITDCLIGVSVVILAMVALHRPKEEITEKEEIKEEIRSALAYIVIVGLLCAPSLLHQCQAK